MRWIHQHQHGLKLAGAISMAAGLVMGVTLAGLTSSAVLGLNRPAGVLPKVETIAGEQIITTRHPDAMERQQTVQIHTRYHDWVSFRNLVSNDVARHGGWSEQSGESTGTVRHHVPASYLTRLQPLLDSAGEKPISSAYEEWARAALEESQTRPTSKTEVVDTIVVIEHDVPLYGRKSAQRTVQAMLGVMCALLAIGGAPEAATAWAISRRSNASRAAPVN